MKFFTAWVEQDASYSTTHHQREDEQVIAFHISHKEGKAPLLKLTVQTPIKLRLKQTYFLLSTDHPTHPVLFHGKLLHHAPHQTQQQETLIFLTVGAFEQGALERCRRALMQSMHYDPLFEKTQTDAGLLESGLLLPHWSRTSKEITLSHALTVDQSLDIGTQYLAKSFQRKVSQVPLSKIHVTLQAEWRQATAGTFDVMPLIEGACDQNKLSSFTPLHYQWWKKGMRLKQYTVVESHLAVQSIEKITLPSHPFPAQPIERYWYTGTLTIGFSYQQKRREVVRFTLENKISSTPSLSKTHPEKQLKFTLQDILADAETPAWQPQKKYNAQETVQYGGLTYQCTTAHLSSDAFHHDITHWESIPTNNSPLQNPAAASYFTTPRGQQSIICAAERGYAQLKRAQRCLETTVMTPLESVIGIDCHQMLHLISPQNESLTGKIIAYQMSGSYKGLYAKITMAQCVDAASSPSILAASEKKIDLTTPSGIQLTGLYDTPIPGFVPTAFQDVSTFVQNVTVHNPGDSQLGALGKSPTTQAPSLTLQHVPTSISLSFRDLSPLPCLTHYIPLTTITP